MDFFEYASIAMQFVNSDTAYVPYVVGGLCFLLVFVFQAIGLFTIARREKIKNGWMAFVPFLNVYFIGVCGSKNRVFRSVDTKIFALAAAILEALLVCGYIIDWTAITLLGNAGCIYEVAQDGIYGAAGLTEYQLHNVPVDLAWAAWCFEFLDTYILSIFNLVFLALEVFVFSAFFQTYAARRYFLFTLTSVLFPIQGILIFIIRNNTGMNYREFMRREQERQYRMYQQYSRQNPDMNRYDQNPYSGGYNNYNPNGYDGYNGNGASRGGPAAEDPFADLGGNNGNNVGNGNNGNGNGGGDPFDL